MPRKANTRSRHCAVSSTVKTVEGNKHKNQYNEKVLCTNSNTSRLKLKKTKTNNNHNKNDKYNTNNEKTKTNKQTITTKKTLSFPSLGRKPVQQLPKQRLAYCGCCSFTQLRRT